MSKRIQRVEQAIYEVQATVVTLAGVIIKTAQRSVEAEETLREIKQTLARIEARGNQPQVVGGEGGQVRYRSHPGS